MNKTFDCVQFQRAVREKHWKESGETFDGLMKYLDEKIQKSQLLKELLKKKEKENQLTSV